MTRLGNGADGMARAIGLATLAPGGSVAVPAALILDEVEHHRAGIGCVLESSSDRSIRVSVIVNGGAAQFSDIREGDVLESINGQQLGQGVTVEACSEYIRGPAGSYVQLGFCRSNGQRFQKRIQRKAVPGGSAEILGTLFQGTRSMAKNPSALTLEERMAKLESLRTRGNLSDSEYAGARGRLLTGNDWSIAHATQPSFNLSRVFDTLGSDVNAMMADPEVLRRKKALLHRQMQFQALEGAGRQDLGEDEPSQASSPHAIDRAATREPTRAAPRSISNAQPTPKLWPQPEVPPLAGRSETALVSSATQQDLSEWRSVAGATATGRPDVAVPAVHWLQTIGSWNGHGARGSSDTTDDERAPATSWRGNERRGGAVAQAPRSPPVKKLLGKLAMHAHASSGRDVGVHRPRGLTGEKDAAADAAAAKARRHASGRSDVDGSIGNTLYVV